MNVIFCTLVFVETKKGTMCLRLSFTKPFLDGQTFLLVMIGSCGIIEYKVFERITVQ